MSHTTLHATKGLLRSAGIEEGMAPFTCLALNLDIHIAALARTILDISEGCPAGIECSVAVCTCGCTTSITNLCAPRSGHKLLPTLATGKYGGAIGETTPLYQFWMFTPELYFLRTMTDGAKGDQVCELICLTIVIKQVKRHHVMNRQTCSLFATVLTCILIPLTRSYSLSVPIRATIVDVPSKPARIILSSPRLRGAPLSEAITATKVMVTHHTWRSFENIAARITCHFYPFAPDADAINFLPFSIAGKTAKRTLGEGHVILTTLYRLAALCTYNFYHEHIIPHVEHTVNGGHFS